MNHYFIALRILKSSEEGPCFETKTFVEKSKLDPNNMEVEAAKLFAPGCVMNEDHYWTVDDLKFQVTAVDEISSMDYEGLVQRMPVLSGGR